MPTNRIRERWKAGLPILNGWLSIPSSIVAEVMARQGFHSLCLDLQHGLLDYGDCLPMLQAISQTDTVPLVRVPWNDPSALMKVLDAGAQGVIVPLVDTAADAARAVAACRYPPRGIRSFGPTRAAMVMGADYHQHANDEILVLAMIETRSGLDNLEAIAATPGLDGIYIGPADLSYALGLPPKMDHDHPEHIAAVDRILAVCRDCSILVGLHTADPAFARQALERGVHLVTVATDLHCLRAEAGRRLAYFDT